MSKLLQLRGGTTSEHSSFTGALREVTVDTDKDTLVIHDGSTAGGHALPRTAAEIVALISNDAIDSQHYAAGSIDLEHMSSESVDEDNLHISNAGTNGQYLQKQSGNAGGLTWGTVDLTTLSATNLTSGIVPTARINAGSIANDLLDSQHYAAGSIDLEHLSSESVDEDNLYISNAGTDGQYLQKQSGNNGGLTWGTVDLTTLSGANLTSGIIPTARINASSIANDLLDSQHYAAGSIDTEHLAADSVTTAKIADSVALGGSPTTTTQSAADNSTKVATTAYADAAVAALADSAPSTLNTLNELAAALGDDANYATTTTTAIGTKMPLAGGAFTGAVTTNSTFDGRDVATDGTKLDGIEANATADQTAAQIKTHLENGIDSVHYVDGSVDDVHISGMAASKLTGALPAISGANLTGVDPFPSGTVMIFYQSAAPTGWTKSTAQNDKALRVVSGAGGGVGGTHGLSSPPSLAHVHTSAAHTHTSAAHTHTSAAHTHGHTLSAAAHTLTTAQMPSHNHGLTAGSSNAAPSAWPNNGGNILRTGQTNNRGSSSSHSHSMSGSVSSATPGASGSTTPGASGSTTPGNSGSTTPTAFAPQYIDVIICAKD